MGLKRKCKHGERGLSPSPEYRTWRAMKARCINSNLKDYSRYGGRGITVCERWQDFQNFLLDMGRRPSLKHTIDRIDVDKGYFKENCRWATPTEQCRNRTNNVLIEINGMTKTMTEWAIEYGIKKTTINKRMKRGWSAVDSVVKPIDTRPWHKKQKEA